MPLQAELLEEQIARLEQKHGPDAPIVKDYRQHLASLKSASKTPRPNPVTLNVGMQRSPVE